MGRGSYTARDWDKLRTARKITTDSSADNLFHINTASNMWNPLPNKSTCIHTQHLPHMNLL